MIEAYFENIEKEIQSISIVVSHQAIRVYPSPNTAYIQGKVLLIDQSVLRFFEFVRKIGNNVRREKYRY